MQQPQTRTQTITQMIDVLRAAKPGDKLEFVFVEAEAFGPKGAFKVFIGGLQIFFHPGLGALPMTEADFRRFWNAWVNVDWQGCRTYTSTVAMSFDIEHFIREGLANCMMLESVSLVA